MLLPLIHLSPEGATLSQSALATGRGAKHLGAAGAEDDSLLKRHRIGGELRMRVKVFQSKNLIPAHVRRL